jgi:hypothetical protein
VDIVEIPDKLRELQALVAEAQRRSGRGLGGRELALAQTKLDEARLWLGEHARLLTEG